MRRTRFGRTSFRSRVNRSMFRSSLGSTRGVYSSRHSVPLKGPMAVIFLIGILSFLLSFAFNFVYIFTTDDFNPIFFFIPFGIMIVMVMTMVIFSFVEMFKAIKSQRMNPNASQTDQFQQPNGFFSQGVNILHMAKQSGLKVTILPQQDPSTAQAFIQNDKLTILVKNLPSHQVYQNNMVQDLSKGLATYQAQEAWLIQHPPTFVDNDLNFARFYNVKLLTIEQALESLKSLTQSPSKDRP